MLTPHHLEHLQSQGGHGLLYPDGLRPPEAVRHDDQGQRRQGGAAPQQAAPLRLLPVSLLPAGAGGQRPARRGHWIREADLVLHEATVRLV